MKRKRILLLVLLFGLLAGWTLGFLRLPYFEANVSFLLGFLAAIALFGLALLLVFLWNRPFLSLLTAKNREKTAQKNVYTPRFIRMLLILVPLIAGVARGYNLYQENKNLHLQIQNQDKQLGEMSAQLQARHEQNLEPLMCQLLEDISTEIKGNPDRSLCDSSMDRIAALCLAFHPMLFVEQDSQSRNSFSPERGQLLQALLLLKLDTATFARIKRESTFAGADLQDADLNGANLSDINLNGANLKSAALHHADLTGAKLAKAKLLGADLQQAKLDKADLTRAELSWAKLNSASLGKTKLSGAVLDNAQLIKADLTETDFQWAQAEGAMFNEAKLKRVNLTGTKLMKAGFAGAFLQDCDLRKVNLSEAGLVGIHFTNVLVDENWQDELLIWKPLGLKEVQMNHSLLSDTLDKAKRPLFRLKQK